MSQHNVGDSENIQSVKNHPTNTDDEIPGIMVFGMVLGLVALALAVVKFIFITITYGY